MEEGQTDLSIEGLVHDLNNIFETISEAADLLASDPNWMPLAATIHRSVDRGRRIVGSYHEGARGSLAFNDILDSAIEFTQDFLQAIHKPPLRFVREVDGEIYLPGTAPAWERVLVNLFINAAQATPDTGGEVLVRAWRDAGGAAIEVADDGPGIADDILPKIFTPRFSTKASRTGLGLHIVESIAAKYGGTVKAANRRDRQGALFEIRLPKG